jgi:hypothetical protein
MATMLEEAFLRMGARARLRPVHSAQLRRAWNGKGKNLRALAEVDPVRVDILRDPDGEYFDIQRRPGVRLDIQDVAPADRHLVLSAHEMMGAYSTSTFLCGHDERAWFVAAIPEDARARTVQQARDALKPQEVWDAMSEFGVSMEERDLRQTAGFIRQGEWFFIPCPMMEIDWDLAIFNEPIQRGAGKPHVCEAMYRQTDGEEVFVSEEYPDGLTPREYFELPAGERRKTRWEQRVRGAEVYVRGRVKHRDHATITLPCWHKVVMNTETRSKAMRHMAFLD